VRVLPRSLLYKCSLAAPFLLFTAVNGIIQGSLPPIALAVLFILLPIVLRRAFPPLPSVPR